MTQSDNSTDVLILGNGVAGCVTAYKLAQEGVQVTLVTSTNDPAGADPHQHCEGIALPADTDSFRADVTRAAGSQGCSRAIDFLVSEAATSTRSFLTTELSIPFDTNDSGELALDAEEGHSTPCVARSKDSTGKAIIQALMATLQEHAAVTVLTDHSAMELLTLHQHSTRASDQFKKPTCIGARLWDSKTECARTILAKETVLATGGMGALYLHSTSDSAANGEGVSLASAAGARVARLSNIQFHPTTFFAPNNQRFRITDRLRRAGGQLLTNQGAPFLGDYCEAPETATASAVAVAAVSELLDTGSDHLWLDLSHTNRTDLPDQYPLLTEFCKARGFDISQDMIPVVPAAHCCNGGVVVDKTGQTTVSRLRAVGEVSATGVHGASRLPGVGQLESVVWGAACAADIAKELAKYAYYLPNVSCDAVGSGETNQRSIRRDWTTLKETMWNNAGMESDRRHVRQARAILEELRWSLTEESKLSKPTADLIALRHAVRTASLVTEAKLVG